MPRQEKSERERRSESKAKTKRPEEKILQERGQKEVEEKEIGIEPEPGTEEKEESVEALKSLYRGIWAERLESGQELPLGGSLFSRELTAKLNLDFESFEKQLSNFTEENIRAVYGQCKDSVAEWLEKVGSDIDPYAYFVCYQAQQKMHELLEVDPNSPVNSFERQKMYQGGKQPKLSELKGKTECGERAAMGQFLLQKTGLESAYVSGITMQDISDNEEFPEDHSYITLKDPSDPEKTLIFDIARPRLQHDAPRVLRTDVPFTYELLKDRDELLVGATEVLQGGSLWFGVGEPVAGQHETIEINKETEESQQKKELEKAREEAGKAFEEKEKE